MGGLSIEEKAALATVTAELGRRARAAAARGDTEGHHRAITVIRVADLVTAANTPTDGSAAENPRNDEHDAAWESQLMHARSDDEHRADRSQSRVPPITSALVTAAMNSRLRRLFPFTSHNLLRLSTSSDLGMRRRDHVAPAFVAVVPDPDRYIVHSGAIGAEPATSILETPDPAAAVAEVERLLSRWS
jgi:hypothetical protein